MKKSDKMMRMLALLETPSGFALFYVANRLFDEPECIWAYFTQEAAAEHVIGFTGFTEVDEKSAARRISGDPGVKLTELIMKHNNGKTKFVTDDEEFKRVIEKKLGVTCFYEKYAVGELMWGLKNVLRYHLHKERDNITCQYLLPLCQGIKDLIDKFKIEIPTEEIDEEFIAYAGALFRYDFMLKKHGKELRERCDMLVPEIGRCIEDDLLYGETMAKILTPLLGSTWDFSEKFPTEMVLKLKAAETAAQNEDGARSKINLIWYRKMSQSLKDLRRLPGMIEIRLDIVKKLAADRCSWRQKLQVAEKRSHQVVEAAERTRNQDEDLIYASSGGGKKARTA